jgi:hypothetical protein
MKFLITLSLLLVSAVALPFPASESDINHVGIYRRTTGP